MTTTGFRWLQVVPGGFSWFRVAPRFSKYENVTVMLSKVSLKLFVYDLIDVFWVPDETVQEIYCQNSIIKCHLYLNLTDTGSCSIFFNFICKKECDIRERESRNLIFEILKQSKIIKRFDLSDELWDQFKICDVKLKKQMDLYEIENTDNANICTIAVNPKEYFEKLKNRLINKKHKGVRRDTPGMNFESYAERINVLKEIVSEKNEKKIV